MTREQLKHAFVSLCLGILTIALTSLLEGAVKLLKEWMIAGAGGSVASATYFVKNFRI